MPGWSPRGVPAPLLPLRPEPPSVRLLGKPLGAVGVSSCRAELCAGGFVPGFVGAGKSSCPLVGLPKARFYLENPGLCHR